MASVSTPIDIEEQLLELRYPGIEDWVVEEYRSLLEYETTLVTEDDQPKDNIFHEKQMRLLPHVLLTNWKRPEGKPFIAMSDVGLFYQVNTPPIVPDVLVSLDVRLLSHLYPASAGRSYLLWRYGKVPELVIEIVSNRQGGEWDRKKQIYEHLGIRYYIIFDPELVVAEQELTIFRVVGNTFQEIESEWFPEVGLGLTLWQGRFEDMESTWLRWTDEQGKLIPTAGESATLERERVVVENQRAESEKQRADSAERRVQELLELLKKNGIEA